MNGIVSTILDCVLAALESTNAEPVKTEPTKAASPVTPPTDANLPQRTQSARYPPEKRPECEFQGLVQNFSGYYLRSVLCKAKY